MRPRSGSKQAAFSSCRVWLPHQMQEVKAGRRRRRGVQERGEMSRENTGGGNKPNFLFQMSSDHMVNWKNWGKNVTFLALFEPSEDKHRHKHANQCKVAF